MGKICIIKSCPSGRKKKSRGKTKKELQSLSFFQARTPERLRSWRKSLGIDLKASHYICHLHFKEEHIKMYEKIIINGIPQFISLVNKKLREEAVPTIEHQFVSLPVQELKVVTKTIPTVTNKHQQHVLTKTEQQVHSKNKQKVEQSDRFKNIPMMPPFWLYVDKHKEYEFIRMDSLCSHIKNHIRLNEDLSITVIFSNNEELDLGNKLTALQDIYEYLKYVERWPLCVGTQIEKKKFSNECKGVIIGDEAYKRHQTNPRCKSCRLLRNQLLNYKLKCRRSMLKSITMVKQIGNSMKKVKGLHTMTDKYNNVDEINDKEMGTETKEEIELDKLNKADINNVSNGYNDDNKNINISDKYKNSFWLTDHTYSIIFSVNPNERNCKNFVTQASNSNLGNKIKLEENFKRELCGQLDGSDENEIVRCEKCPAKFISLIDLSSHVVDIHCMDQDSHEEIVDSKDIIKVKSLGPCIVEKVKPKNVKSLSCRICNKSFRTLGHLKRHERYYLHTNNKCVLCKEYFRTKKELMDHLFINHPDCKPQRCPICHKPFLRTNALKKHIIKVHNRDALVCSICKKIFSTAVNLHEHIIKDHTNQMYKCSTCEKKYPNYQEFKRHTLMHKQRKKFLCPTCGKIFYTSTNLRSHIMCVHNKIKKFSCAHCSKKFGTKAILKKHILTHSEVKLYQCGQCNTEFRTAFNLRRHCLLHLGIKSHECNICFKKFAAKDSLKIHYMIHTGEKPYCCDNCGQKFRSKARLLKHRKKHISEIIYMCNQCPETFDDEAALTEHMNTQHEGLP